MSTTKSGISYIGKYDIAKIRELFEWDNIYFWLISGNTIHNFEKNWKNEKGEGRIVGGNHYSLPYIPENEIWINNVPKDIDSIILHQYIQRLLIKEENLNLETADTLASKIVNMQKVIEK